MLHSEKIDQITKALIEAQKNIETVIKNKTVKGSFSFNYADLAAVIKTIKEPLNTQSIVIVQAVDAGEGENAKPTIETRLIHESGQWIGSRTPIMCAKQNDPQAFGSGVSYAKRYALTALLGLPTEDDDGQAAKKKDVKFPDPTEEEMQVISDICSLLNPEPGFMVNPVLVAKVFYAERKEYPPDDCDRARAAKWLWNLGRDIFIKDNRGGFEKEYDLPGDEHSQPDQQECRYVCSGCDGEFDALNKDGRCPKCFNVKVTDRRPEK